MPQVPRALKHWTSYWGVALCVVCVLGGALGLNLAVGSSLYEQLRRRPPFPSPGRLVFSRSPLTLRAFRHIQESPAFEAVAAFAAGERTALVEGTPFRVGAATYSTDFFHTLGAEVAAGRLGDGDSNTQIAVIGHGMARRMFGSPGRAIGRVILIDGHVVTVIGVLRSADYFPLAGIDVWRPMGTGAEIVRLSNGQISITVPRVRLVGRLRGGVTIESARLEAHRLLGADRVRPDPEWLIDLYRAQSTATRSRLIVLQASVLLILALGIFNATSLLLAHYVNRSGELGVRLALGSTRRRLVAMLAGECAWLACPVAALAWGAGTLSLSVLSRLIGHSTSTLTAGNLVAAAGAAAGLVVCAGVLSAHLALRDSHVQLHPSRGIGGRRARTLQSLQMAIGGALTLTAISTIWSLGSAVSTKPMFARQDVVATDIEFVGPRYTNFQERWKVISEAIQSAAMQGRVSATSSLPFLVSDHARPLHAPRRGVYRTIEQDDGTEIELVYVGPGFFETIGWPLLRGRGIEWTDREQTERVAIVSAGFSGRVFGSTEVDHHIELMGQRWRVIGVAAPLRATAALAREPDVYLPIQQLPDSLRTTALRSVTLVASAAPGSELPARIRATIKSIDPDIGMGAVRSLEERFYGALLSMRVFGLLLASFAGLAVGIGALGLYGLAATYVSSHVSELAIRAALGARPVDGFISVVRQTLAVSAFGTAAAIPLGFWLHSALNTVLPGLQRMSPMVVAVAAAAMLGIGLVSGFGPAIRATRLDSARLLSAAVRR